MSILPTKTSTTDEITEIIEEKKELAIENGLDRLLSNVYHKILVFYPDWLEKSEKKYIYPKSTGIKRYLESEGVDALEIQIKNNLYKITSEEWNDSIDYEEGRYNNLILYLNNKKVFGITEKISTIDEWSTQYDTRDIKVFINQLWVKDLKEIANYKKITDKETPDKKSEETEKLEELEEDFGITDAEKIISSNSHMENLAPSKIKRTILWSIIVIICLIVISRLLF